MLKACVGQVSRAACASTSKLPGCSASWTPALLHTSSVSRAVTQRQRTARITRIQNIERKAERARRTEQNKPHVVLGTRPGDDAKWLNCNLAQVLLTPEAIDAAAEPALLNNDENALSLPQHLSFGVDGGGSEAVRAENVQFFFEDLPNASAARDFLLSSPQHFMLKSWVQKAEAREHEKARQFARIIDLRNANARGVAFENRRRVIAEFSEPGKPDDSGRPEVQAALLTMKIRNMWDHLMKFKKDLPNRRALRQVVHQRAKILKYLKRIDRDRYDRVLERLALEPESVEGELVV